MVDLGFCSPNRVRAALLSHSSAAKRAMYSVTLPLLRPPLTLNDQRRAHWTKVRRAKAEVEELVGWQARAQLPKGLRLDRIHLTVTWYAPDARIRDADSLSVLTKGALDSLVKCGYLPGDDHKHVLSVRQQIRIDREHPRIVLELEEEKV